jgi:hypothetical protein
VIRKYVVIHLGIISRKHQHNYDRKKILAVISAAILVGSFVVTSQFVQLSLAQDLSQFGQQAKDRIGGVLGQFTGGNQTGNQTDNQLVECWGNSVSEREATYQDSKIIIEIVFPLELLH